MELTAISYDYETQRVYCPSTDEVLVYLEDIMEEASALIAYYLLGYLDEPFIKNEKLAAAWDTYYARWNEMDEDMRDWEKLEKFLKEYDQPEWIAMEHTDHGIACGPIGQTVYWVVKADSIIEDAPEIEEEEEERDEENTEDKI